MGNKAAVFPLQLLGFDVDVVNSVHFSNHTGYREGFEGDVLKGDQLRAIMAGLARNDLLDIGFVLTGYIGSESFLEAILDVIKTLRQRGEVGFVCDPVLGDKGRFYVPKELVGLYREKVIPLADVLTPNQFEAEQLTECPINTIEDAKNACRNLHTMGPRLVFITSMTLPAEDANTMAILASERISDNTVAVWRIDCPMLPVQFTGTGDLCAALLLAHSSRQPDNIPFVMEKVINTMFAVLERTHKAAGETVKSRELKLIQSKDIIEDPPQRFKATRIE